MKFKDQEKKRLTGEISEVYKENFFNGFAVSIVNEKETLYENGFGFSDASTKKEYTTKTIQNIASNSKPLLELGY